MKRRPDLDNQNELVLDAPSGIAYGDDIPSMSAFPSSKGQHAHDLLLGPVCGLAISPGYVHIESPIPA
jgi:hypothetical protein